MSTDDRMKAQSAEFDAAVRFGKATQRLMQTPVVDDDYPMVRHDYESALSGLLAATRANGRGAVDAAPALSNTAGAPVITVEMWDAGSAAYTKWIMRAYLLGRPTDEQREEGKREAIAAMTAAAPAASGGECNCASGRGAEHCIVHAHAAWDQPNPPSAASVSELARELLAAEYDKIGLNGAATYIRSGQHGELDKAIIRAIEQALTQQRGEEAVAVVGPGGYPNWLVSWLESPGYRTLPQGTKLYTTPQPSADAVRGLQAEIRGEIHGEP